MRTPARRPLTVLLGGLLVAGGAPGVAHLATAGGAAATGTTATAGATAEPGPAVVPARSAAAFLDSVGVVVHTDDTTGPYTRSTLLAQRLQELGVRHVRTHLSPTPLASQTATLQAFAAAGIGLDVTGPRPTGDPVRDRRLADALVQSLGTYGGPVDSVEGTNEYDVRGPADWPDRLRSMSSTLYAAVRAAPSPSLAAVPVLSPSLVGHALATDAPLLGDLSAVTTSGGLHSYPGAAAPEVSRVLADADVLRRTVSGPTAPVVVTETGYHGALASTGGVPDQVAATYLPRLLLGDFAAGLPRTYVYELADEGSVVDGAHVPETGLVDPEAHFGLLDVALEPKPAAQTLSTLMSLLAGPDPAAPAADPGGLAYSLSGGPTDLRQVLLQRADGTFVVALWRAAPVYDAKAKQQVAVPAVPVRLDLGRAAAELAAYDLASGTQPVTTARGAGLALTVGAGVTLVRVRPVQAPPTDVQATPLPGAADVSWTAPPVGPSPVTGYRVTAEPGAVSTTVGVDERKVVLGGLVNGVPQTVRVTALSAAGDSDPSAPSGPVVPAAVPGPPRDVRTVAGDGRADVSWTPPADDGGAPVTGYTVTADPGGATATTTGTAVVLSGLVDGTEYRLTVQATNRVGAGPGSLPSDPVRPHHEPSAPSAVVAEPHDGSVSVSWTPAPGTLPGTTFTATATPGGRSATGLAPPLLVDGLVDGTAYTVTVTATDPVDPDAGPSGVAESAPSAPVVPAGVPATPSAPVVTVAGGTAVALAWSAPDGRGADITAYRVTVLPDGRQIDVTGPGATATGLTPGATYRFTVAAHNAVGSSGDSDPSLPVVPAAAPDAPSRVVAVRGDGAATLSWTAPADNGSPVTSYVVTTSPGGATTRVDTPGAVVTGLTNGTSYTFVVRAVNAAGAGLDSGPSAAVAPAGLPPAPGAVTAVPGSTGALVRWLPSATTGGPLLRYAVTATPGGSTVVVDGATTSAVVPGLVNGTRYSFAVRAATVAGSGPSGRSGPVVPSLAPVVLDDRSPAVVPGGWTAVPDRAVTGGSYRVSTTAGDTVSIRFTGDTVSWATRTGPAAGAVTAQVDAKPPVTIDLRSTGAGRTTRTLSGWGAGVHQLTLTLTGSGAPVAVEGFGTAAGVVDDSAVPVSWSGWSGTAAAQASGGGQLVSSLRGTLTVTGTGTGLEWLTTVGPSAGRATVLVDGVLQPEVDLYAPSAAPRTLSWLGLPPGPHTLTVVVLGKRRVVSTGTDVVVDAFGVRR